MVICNVAILVSGKGINALNIIEYFEKRNFVHISVLISNNASSLAVKKHKKRVLILLFLTMIGSKEKCILISWL